MYDVIIVGCGPSGATLARLIGKNHRVLVLDRRDFNEKHKYNREKSCGGLIAPDAQMMLARFGLGVPKTVLENPQIFAVRVMDLDNSIERYYQRNYINIDREGFDKWMASLIPDNVSIMYNSLYKSYKSDRDGISIKFIHNGKEYEEKGKILVGADGAFSKIRRQGFVGLPQPSSYISIQEWFKTDKNIDYHSAIFDSEVTDFYSWTIPKEDYLIVGSAMKPTDNLHIKFNLLKDKLRDNGFILDNSRKINGTHLLRTRNINQICTGDDKIALIGEAAGFISPSSAEGLSYGFRSALALSKAINEDLNNYQGLYKSYIKSLKTNIIMKNIKIPAMYNKHLRKIIMKSRLLSLDVEPFKYDYLKSKIY